MTEFTTATEQSLRLELSTIWQAHHAVGLRGKMCLYTAQDQSVWRTKKSGLAYWFGPDDTDAMIAQIKTEYNNGMLSNSPLLLNPVVHDEVEKPLGSGVIWSTGFALGIETLQEHQRERIRNLGVPCGDVQRGDVARIGLKMLAFSTTALMPKEDGTIPGGRELFELAHFSNDEYFRYYFLSGLSYLSKHGSFLHPNFQTLIPERSKDLPTSTKQIDVQLIKDAAYCWNVYEHQHSMYAKFGPDPKKAEKNLRFYDLCGRDIQLFDATGSSALGTDDSGNIAGSGFNFVAQGWLARGMVVLLAGSGGAGKSSLAHNLAVKAALPVEPGSKALTWLDAPIVHAHTQGLSVYFNAEDDPAIIRARAALYDPAHQAERILFQRADFGEGMTFAAFLKRLKKLPDVPLLVIDPARKYLTGSEDNDDVVNEFFDAVEDFAVQKQTAIVIIHPLARGAKPENITDITDMLRGSQAFADRPRAIIGMIRQQDDVLIGFAKNSIPPQMGMIQGTHRFARHAESLELIKLA